MYDTIEDATVGETIDCGSYAVEADEIREFAERYDPQPFHVDPDAARESQFGGLVASGWHTGAITQRLLVEGFLEGSGGMGSPGVSDLRWRRPVRAGDELALEVTVTDVEDWDAERGLLHVDLTTRRGDGEPVMTMTVEILFPREP